MSISQKGYTALLYASRKGHKEIVKMLLANPDTDANLQTSEVRVQ